MKRERVIIPALDDYPLDALVIKPKGSIKGIIQFNCGTAVKKEFYLRFCSYLAEQGYIVVMYDYRGVGFSRPENLKGFEAYMHQWGTLDMPGILNWIVENYPKKPRFIVAHSMGGQLIGLMNNHHLLNGIVTIATSTGYIKYLPTLYRIYCNFFWYIYFPITTKIFGFAPGRKLHLGEDIPKGVAEEWAHWCTNESYISQSFGKSISKNYYDKVSCPFKALVVDDDKIATTKSVPHMLSYYKNARIDLEWLTRKSLHAKRVGHFGYFSEKYKDTIWKKVSNWLENEMEIPNFVHDVNIRNQKETNNRI